VRVKGAMIGIELSSDGAAIVGKCLEQRLLINCTHGTVLRLLPALNIADEQIDEGLAIMESVLLGKSN
jgi:acetylornithine/N-succinyldiaminopimelate aminotransferase